jgi:hypothetical protein
LAEAAVRAVRRAEPTARLRVARRVRLLHDSVASADGGGLLVRGSIASPITRYELAAQDPSMAIAVDGLLRLAHLSESIEEALGDHPEPRVRRAAASLAARAYPLLSGLEGA